MPRGDRTGPGEVDAMSGRGAGYCGGFSAPGYARPAVQHRFRRDPTLGHDIWGRAPGNGWRWRHWFYATGLPGWMRGGRAPAISQHPDPETERRVLENRADALQAELDSIRKRLHGIASSSSPE
jgi:hypothetical protein